MRRRRGRQGMSGDERVGELEQRVGPPGQAAVETSSEGAARLALGGVIGDAERSCGVHASSQWYRTVAILSDTR